MPADWLKFMQDPLWQFVGAVLALLAILVTVGLAWRQRTVRALTYQIVSNSRLVSIRDNMAGRIAVTLDGQVVPNVYLVLVKIRNEGNSAIRHDEYERPISIEFSTSAQLLSAEVAEVSTPNLQVSAAIQGSKVVLAEVGISKGEWFTVKVLATGIQPLLHVDWRLPDVPIQVFTPTDGSNWRLLMAALLVTLAGSFVTLTLSLQVGGWLALLGGMTTGMAFAVLAMLLLLLIGRARGG